MVETRQKTNLWAASHAEKWRHVPTKPEEKIPMHQEGKTRSLHRPRLMGGGEGNIGRKVRVVKSIEHKRDKKVNNNGIREDGGVLSPMSITRLKQGLKMGWGGGGDYNMSKIIEKQCFEGEMGNYANAPKTIGKTGFEEMGVATCAQ